MIRAVGLFGVPGVGKSTLLAHHLAAHSFDRGLSGSDIVKAIIAPATTRELDAWPAARQAAVRRESIRRLEVMRDETPRFLVVAGHFSLRNRISGVIEPILVDADHAFFDALILLDGTTERVLQQSLQDSRSRHGQSQSAVTEHLVFERELAAETAARMGVPLARIAATNLSERLARLATVLAGWRAQIT